MNFLNRLEKKGHFFRHENCVVFFGNDQFDGNLGATSSRWLHQIHSKTIIRARETKEKADGHYTSKKNETLFIKTADCMPVFLTGEDQIIALHIGWRGLMKKILSETKGLIKNPKSYKIFVGPHIGFDSFQLDHQSATELLHPHNLDVATALKKGWARKSFNQNKHTYIDLYSLLCREAQSMGFSEPKRVEIDTFKSPVHFSHRRNRWRIGQNFSFCVKL